MITRHHVVLGLFCSLILGSAIAEMNPVPAVLVTTGTVAGVILPDIHMTRSKSNILRRMGWWVVRAGRWICVPVLCFIYRRFLNIACEPDDKRLTHSLPGIVGYFVILAVITSLLTIPFRSFISVSMVMVFLGGLLLGLLLHLGQDLCTHKGIFPFYPFNDIRFAGSIRPCDIFDKRIPRIQICHGLVLILFLVLLYTLHWPIYDLLICSYLGVCTCIGYMFCVSEISIKRPLRDNSVSPYAAAVRRT
ncbi:metal-dependent hydrolase [Methanoregula sp.]|uniref:metal-dependent hydrolase n=1 Tax=Methanoregula sp. TaxID=2052170 RepID=UPI00236B4813|nr:metal-dependent hydrolase [Methanoregula sp.]MDD1686454.1 metal-dependent hydrolase [Methanoregula sp.]